MLKKFDNYCLSNVLLEVKVNEIVFEFKRLGR